MKTSRREFLKIIPSVIAGCATVGMPTLSFGQTAPTNAVDENSDPMAKALGYSPDATKVDTVKFPKRAGAEGAKQLCSNCVLLTQGGLKADGKEGEYGKCALFQAGLVNANGWCNSWAPKAA